jgi:hypothetical protein
MGMIVAFAAGWVMGARAGSEDYSDVVQSLRAIRESEEFHQLLSALRVHAGQTLRRMADVLDSAGVSELGDGDIVARVRYIVGRE